MRPKGKESVRSAVEKIYPTLPNRFSLISLHSSVVREIRRPYLFGDTTRRKLFQLREEGRVNFKNVDKARSIYVKVPVTECL